MAAATASSALKRLDLRDPNALFETHGAEEIRGLERQVRAEIEHKKEELRQMVGERYRDLIEAADTIGQMRRCAEGLVDAVQATDQYCARLRQAGSAAPRVPRAPQVSPGSEPATSRRPPPPGGPHPSPFAGGARPSRRCVLGGGVCGPSSGCWSAAEKSAGLLLQEPSRTSGGFPRLPWVPCALLPLKMPGVSRQSRTDLSSSLTPSCQSHSFLLIPPCTRAWRTRGG